MARKYTACRGMGMMTGKKLWLCWGCANHELNRFQTLTCKIVVLPLWAFAVGLLASQQPEKHSKVGWVHHEPKRKEETRGNKNRLFACLVFGTNKC